MTDFVTSLHAIFSRKFQVDSSIFDPLMGCFIYKIIQNYDVIFQMRFLKLLDVAQKTNHTIIPIPEQKKWLR